MRGIAITLFIIACGFAGIVNAQQPAQQPPIRQVAPGSGGAPVQRAAPQAPAQPREPFKLTPEQQAAIDQLLVTWEQQSDKVKSFKCSFTRWDYDKTWGPAKNNFLKAERRGQIKFRAPDNGTFKEEAMKMFDPQTTKYVDSKEDLEHWVCDGKSIYQFNPKKKEVHVTNLPPHMQGKAITQGPLPFIFGAKAETLKQRYWIRETTPKQLVGQQIWLQAYPKFAEQAADFQRVEVILTPKDMLPMGMEIYTPNGQDWTSYLFEQRVVNDPWSTIKMDFAAPMTPFGWKKVVDPVAPPAAAQKQKADEIRK